MNNQVGLDSRAIKVALVSSITPEETHGGKLLLHRHLKMLSSAEILVISDGFVADYPCKTIRHRFLSRIFKKIEGIGFRKLGRDLQELFLPCSTRKVVKVCQDFHPDLILTVAHDAFGRIAGIVAGELKLPLVTFFHDWWPDLAGTHHALKNMLDARFRKLYQQSASALCVCEGMLAELGPHPAAEVLYPVPGFESVKGTCGNQSAKDRPCLKVVYMGNFGEYATMVMALMEATKDHPGIRFEARGPGDAFPAEFSTEMKSRGLLHAFAQGQVLEDWLADADAFLLPMRFDQESARFMRTTFPSKLLEYVRFRKPIIVWGPEYCSGVRWGRSTSSAVCVTSQSPDDVIDVLDRLSGDDLERYSLQSSRHADGDFNAERIHSQFETALARVCGR